jgi:hypothetical protein
MENILLRRMRPSIEGPRDRVLIVDIDNHDGSAMLACENGARCADAEPGIWLEL